MGKQTQKALRVGIFLDGRLIEERLFWKPQSITIGRSAWRTDIVVPSAKLPARQQLFSRRDGQFFLELVDGARVRLAREGKGTRQVEADGERVRVPVSDDMRGKVTLGEVAVMFHCVERTRPATSSQLPKAFRGAWMRQLSPVSAAAIVLSALLQVGFVAWVMSQEWPEPLEAQIFAENDFAQVIIPPKEEQREPPEPVEPTEDGAPSKSAQKDASPAKSASKEDYAGPTKDESPEPMRMADRVEKETIVGIIGSKGPDGESAVDQILATANDTTMDQAFAGANKVRTGRVGSREFRNSGRDDQSPGKTVGVGGLERTPGARQADKAVTTGEKEEEEVECRTCTVTIPEDPPDAPNPTLSKMIAKELRRMKHRIAGCYERRVKQYPTLAGKVVVTFTVGKRGSRGRVVDSRAAVDSVGQGVGSCVAGQIKRMRLPSGPASNVIVNKTFVFEHGR